MCTTIITILLVFCANFACGYQQWKTIYDKITQEDEFSGYRTMISSSRASTLNLLYYGVTVFVPSNEAVRSYDGFFSNGLVLYHMATKPFTLKDLNLNNSLESAQEDNPPLWVSVVSDGYYINNGKIIEERSNYVAKCKREPNTNQVLHVVDRVLDPMLNTPFSKPSAFDFLENYQHWKLGARKVFNFLTRVQYNDKEELFRKPGGHTFFIPVDDKMDEHRLQNIDSYIIEGHVIPNMVLFTRPTAKNFFFETAANGDYIYIVLSMTARNDKYYIKSYTVLGDSDHRKGEVLTEIVKADIPVTNGVVHLISKPLAVFDRELQPFPYLSVFYKIAADPNINITFTLGSKRRLNKILKRERGLYTYFAPQDSAWSNYSGYHQSTLVDILGRHLVVGEVRYTMAKLVATSKNNNGTILETLGGSISLKTAFHNGSYFLKWDQKWIRVIRPDYQCSDGVVHIIDDVFAAPKVAPPHQRTPKNSIWRMLKNAFM